MNLPSPNSPAALSERSVAALESATQQAEAMGAYAVHSGHLALGILKTEGLGQQILAQLGVDFASFDREMHLHHASGREVTAPLDWAGQARMAVQNSSLEALSLNHDTVGTEHLLLALTRLHACDGARMLAQVGAHYEAVRAQLVQIIADDGL